jgi:hypothetical protein
MLQITADSLHIDASSIGATGFSAGNGGDMLMNVGTLRLTGGAKISSDTAGPGHGGEIAIVAKDLISITGRPFSRSMLSSDAFSSGDAGRLSISTPLLTMDGGVIQTNAWGNSRGNAGNIDLRLGRLMLTGSAQISSSTAGMGDGGEVSVVATEAISIVDGGLIRSSTTSTGRGGSVTVEATNLQLTKGGISAFSSETGNGGRVTLMVADSFQSDLGFVTAEATRASGGEITLTAGSQIHLRRSGLTASVGGGPETVGGNLVLDAPSIISQGSLISATATAGQGGHIQISSNVFLADPASLISASSTTGIQGTVDIQAPVTSLSGALAPLPQAFVNVAALFPVRCAARWSGGKASSLVLGGRGGLPLEPGSVLPSPLALGKQLMADLTVTGAPSRQESIARFALLAGHEKTFPRLAGDCAH